MLKNTVKILLLSFVLISPSPSLADAHCEDVRAQCEDIIQAFEKEIELKDLMIVKSQEVVSIIEKQRDAAYRLAEHNPSLFNKVLLGITGVGLGCAVMAEDAEVRLVCLAAGMLTCALGGC